MDIHLISMNDNVDFRDFDISDNETNIKGPISIEENNLVSQLEYSDNFEVSFEYKASAIPSSGSFHEIIIETVLNFKLKLQLKTIQAELYLHSGMGHVSFC